MDIEKTNLRKYRDTLDEIARHLARFGVDGWAERLGRWVSEVDTLEQSTHAAGILDHVARSQRATGGMGSLGDIFISPEAGDKVPNDDAAIDSANEQLAQLVACLYEQTLRLLGRDVRHS